MNLIGAHPHIHTSYTQPKKHSYQRKQENKSSKTVQCVIAIAILLNMIWRIELHKNKSITDK